MYLGDFPVNGVVHFKWNTTAVAGQSITRATNGTLRVYKADGTTERSSSAGITETEDFDSITGVHHVKIDLSDNTDSGFYAAGSEIQIVMSAMTIDGLTINFCIAHFSIERAGGVLAMLKDGTYGLSALETLVDDLESRLTSARAAALDNIDIGGDVASQASVDAVDDFVDTEVAAILAAVDTEIATILSRIGSFTGSGINTILGVLQAICRADVSIPSDIGGTFDNEGESLEAIGLVTYPMRYSVNTMIVGTTGTGSTTTEIVAATVTPAIVDPNQWRDRTIIFLNTTADTALRSQGRRVISHTESAGAGTFTVQALTTAPGTGETFVIL